MKVCRPTTQPILMRLVTNEAHRAQRGGFPDGDHSTPPKRRRPRSRTRQTLAWEVEVYFSSPPDEDSVRELIALAAGPEAAAAVIFDDHRRKGLGEGLARGSWPPAPRAVRGAWQPTTGTACPATPSASRSRRPSPLAPATTGPRCGLPAGAGRASWREARPAPRARRRHRHGRARHRRRPRAAPARRLRAISTRLPLKQRVRTRSITARWRLCAASGRPGRQAIRCWLAGKPYDLVFANILARPLMRLAPSIAVHRPRRVAKIILSGLIPRDVPGSAPPAYRAQRPAPRAQDGTRRLGHPAPARWRRGWAAAWVSGSPRRVGQ